jgi:branched-chain amino acid transport system substrate-binding protein
MRKWYRVGALAIGVTLAVGALAGCGAVGNSGTTNGGTVCIGTDFPVSGTDATSGTPAQNGAVLAADQAATLHGNYKLQVKTFDDAVNGVHNATQGATNVTKMVSDPCILAMVGPFNSGVAGAEIPIATAAGLAMISPANTNPGLTLQQYAQKYGFTWTAMHPSGKPEAYFRLPANDVVQGQEDAAIATQANYTKAYVVDDSESYGQGLADFFTQYFTQGGTGTVLGRDAINGSNTAQLTALVDKMKATSPQVVFYGGVTANGGAALRLAMSTNGMSAVPMIGGDGIAGDPGFIQIAGNSAQGTTGTVAAPDISGLTGNPAAQKFQTDYQNKYSTAPITYSVVSYDAANIEIAAINSVIDSGKAPTRANVLAAIANTNYNGIIGNIRFDQNGDNSGQKVFSIYTVQNGQWVFVKQVPVQ